MASVIVYSQNPAARELEIVVLRKHVFAPSQPIIGCSRETLPEMYPAMDSPVAYVDKANLDEFLGIMRGLKSKGCKGIDAIPFLYNEGKSYGNGKSGCGLIPAFEDERITI